MKCGGCINIVNVSVLNATELCFTLHIICHNVKKCVYEKNPQILETAYNYILTSIIERQQCLVYQRQFSNELQRWIIGALSYSHSKYLANVPGTLLWANQILSLLSLGIKEKIS